MAGYLAENTTDTPYIYMLLFLLTVQISELNGWVLSTLEEGGLTLLPRFFDGWLEAKTYLLNVNNINVHINPTSTRYTPSNEVHYWLAPMMFLGNRVSSVMTHSCVHRCKKVPNDFS